jgi:uncharacterized membrane protein
MDYRYDAASHDEVLTRCSSSHNMRRNIAAALFTWTILVVPAGAQERSDVQVFYCHNLEILTMRVLPGQVELMTPSRKTVLRTEAIASSPVRYTDGKTTVSVMEDYLRLDESGGTYWCRSIPEEVPWQAAKLRGIEFRAAGSDPAWTLEVDSGVYVEFVTDRDGVRNAVRFPAVDLDTTQGEVKLSVSDGPHTLTLVAEPRFCHLAGSSMSLSVVVTIDATTFSGCGRHLNPESSTSR